MNNIKRSGHFCWIHCSLSLELVTSVDCQEQVHQHVAFLPSILDTVELPLHLPDTRKFSVDAPCPLLDGEQLFLQDDLLPPPHV